jgi:hypothetical protein|tara:strand:- start:5695 stop:5922 length:228 start_codon:yes stop_codon:yes gene_type:complete
MGDIIEFKPKQTVFVLNFTSPNPIKMTKVGGENIALEIRKVDESHGVGQAWVPASNVRNAKEQLRKMIEVIEFIS